MIVVDTGINDGNDNIRRSGLHGPCPEKIMVVEKIVILVANEWIIWHIALHDF